MNFEQKHQQHKHKYKLENYNKYHFFMGFPWTPEFEANLYITGHTMYPLQVWFIVVIAPPSHNKLSQLPLLLQCIAMYSTSLVWLWHLDTNHHHLTPLFDPNAKERMFYHNTTGDLFQFPLIFQTTLNCSGSKSGTSLPRDGGMGSPEDMHYNCKPRIHPHCAVSKPTVTLSRSI